MPAVSTSAIAIFVKTPGRSPVKTRLGQRVGAEQAEAFYRHSLKETASTIREWCVHSEAEAFWAVAEVEALGDPIWQGFSTLPQGAGALGQRLHCIYERLFQKYNSVIFVGGDCPHIDPGRITEARARLASEEATFVFGPTTDGGFYLFGGNAPIPKEIWTEVAYSQSTTLSDLQRRLTALGSIEMLKEDFDVDDYESLERLAQMDSQYAQYL